MAKYKHYYVQLTYVARDNSNATVVDAMCFADTPVLALALAIAKHGPAQESSAHWIDDAQVLTTCNVFEIPSTPVLRIS
jgi:hypothetical protein